MLLSVVPSDLDDFIVEHAHNPRGNPGVNDLVIHANDVNAKLLKKKVC